MVASHAPPIGDLDGYPGMYPDWESKLRPFGLQASAESSELHQLGLHKDLLMKIANAIVFMAMENWKQSESLSLRE